jgi:MarR family 2-MHQ and catechol resistance regulon transcriptional repressor
MFSGGSLKNDKRAELAGEFMLSIERLIKGTAAIFRRVLEDYDVTLAQFHLLMVVKGHGRTTVTEISRLQMIAPPTASRMIDGLCAKGLLEKEKDPSDHRITRISLTGKSKRLVTDLTERRAAVLTEVFKSEDEKDLEQTVCHLGKITDSCINTMKAKASRGQYE